MGKEERRAKSDEIKAQGNNEFKKGKYDLAISFYNIALQHFETSVLYSNIARCHLVISEQLDEDLAKNRLDK